MNDEERSDKEDNEEMDDETEFEKTIEAGKILDQVREETKEKVKPGTKLLDIAEFVEGRIVELGAQPAFPCNISIDSDAAHFTPKKGDSRVFEEGNVVKIDMGSHIDGYIADTATTIDLGDNERLVKASQEALNRAIENVYAGADTANIGNAIEEAIRGFGYKPIINLTGHGLQPYLTHTKPTIYNFGTDRGVTLEEGMIIAIEPFATDGSGKVVERGETEIYSFVNPKTVRMKKARELLDEIKEYKTLPFAKRWLNKASPIILGKLVNEGVIRGYPVLSEAGKGLVSQSEHTMIVEEDGAKVIT